MTGALDSARCLADRAPTSAALETLVVLAMQAVLIIWSTRATMRVNAVVDGCEHVSSRSSRNGDGGLRSRVRRFESCWGAL